MKKIFMAACSIALFVAGCKEIPPDINFGTASATDTTYILSAIPTTDAHNVLAEEFSGQSCTNCPAGKTLLDGIVSSDSPHVIVVSLYVTGSASVLQQPQGAAYDLQNATAYSISSVVYGGVSQWPIAGIDRVPVSGSMLLGSSLWVTAVPGRITVPDSLNLGVSSTYDNTTGMATIIAQITYTQAVSTKQNLSIVIVEDSIIDFQEMPFGVVDSFYMFNDIFRDMVTAAPLGDPVVDSLPTKVPGRFVQSVYTYKLPVTVPAIKPAHCRVIAFVNGTGDAGNFQVYQSAQAKFMGP